LERKRLPNDACPIARSLDVVCDWWTLLIIRDALAGVTRFNTFQRCLGVARNSLSARLTALVERGLLAKRPASDGSAFMEYGLSTGTSIENLGSDYSGAEEAHRKTTRRMRSAAMVRPGSACAEHPHHLRQLLAGQGSCGASQWKLQDRLVKEMRLRYNAHRVLSDWSDGAAI
jgi:DNA-binding HxlR family transcriptional regulator